MTGDELRAIRERLNCTGETFARALDYAGLPQSLQTIVYKFETGRRNIPEGVARLAAMFDRYGIPEKIDA